MYFFLFFKKWVDLYYRIQDKKTESDGMGKG